MLTTSPHLDVRRPSPTTIEYTVSTAPPTTLSIRLLHLTTFLLRLTLGLSTLLLLSSKWHLNNPPQALPGASPSPLMPTFEDSLWQALGLIHSSALGSLFSSLASRVQTPLLLPASAFVLYAIFLRFHTQESLLVLRGLGIQTSTSGTTYLGAASTRFIPTEKIQDILVNEAFRGFEVRYYLIVVVQGEDEVVVVFPSLLPGRNIVEKVWRGARGCLYDEEKRERSEKEAEGGK